MFMDSKAERFGIPTGPRPGNSRIDVGHNAFSSPMDVVNSGRDYSMTAIAAAFGEEGAREYEETMRERREQIVRGVELRQGVEVEPAGPVQ